MSDKRLGTVGWKEFHRNRKNILDEFDRVKEQTVNRPIKVAHGVAVEAYIRSWLSEFLPKKYAVTSGYIIPDTYQSEYKLYHYDIIIYNVLDSPILWAEGNLDDSEQGKCRAIPAKYVMAIYEVKSTLTKKTAKDTINKLKELNALSSHFPDCFSSGAIFIDLKKSDITSDTILPELYKGCDVFGYWGGCILRCEIDTSMTGLLNFTPFPDDFKTVEDIPKDPTCLARPINEQKVFIQEDGSLSMEGKGTVEMVYTGENGWGVIKAYTEMYYEESGGISLSWSRSKFSDFSIKIIDLLDGINDPEAKKNTYGRVFDNIEKKEPLIQLEKPVTGAPHLILKPYKEPTEPSYVQITNDGGKITLVLTFQVENIGDSTTTVSTNGFKDSQVLPPNAFATFDQRYIASSDENSELTLDKFNDMILQDEKGMTFPVRIAYSVEENESKTFYKVEAKYSYIKGCVV